MGVGVILTSGKWKHFVDSKVLLSATKCLTYDMGCRAFYRDEEKYRWFLALSSDRWRMHSTKAPIKIKNLLILSFIELPVEMP